MGIHRVLRSAHELMKSCYRVTILMVELGIFPVIWNNAGNGSRINFRGKMMYPTRYHSIVDLTGFGARLEPIPSPFSTHHSIGQ